MPATVVPAKYTKAITAIVGAAVIICTQAFGVNSAVVQDIIVVATALGVYTLPNK